MVICKFFQNGSCRFGTKCANEHFDVKQLIKTEIEAALQGRQWPLSSFGPFKEKSCFPNFIEDQSFEEIRLLCYDAKKQNYFSTFAQQFNQQVMEAQNNMKTLLTLNREIVDIVTSIYDSNSESGQQKPSTLATNTNPFAQHNNSAQQSVGLFGNQQQQTNPFAKTNTQSGFGGTAAGIFGGSGGQASGSGVLGQSSFGNSIFGGSANQQQQQQSSLFSSQLGQQQPNTFGGFGQQQQSSNIFSQPAQQQPSASIFGGQMQAPTQQPFGSSIFGQPPAQPQPQSNPFSQTPVQPTGGNIFAQANQPSQQPTGFAGFGQPQNDQQFQQSQSIFGAQNQQQQPLQPLPQANIFTQQQSNSVTAVQSQSNIFGGLNQQQAQQNVNQITEPQNQNFFTQSQLIQNQQPNQPQMTNISGQSHTGIYSKIEDLCEEDIQAFKADIFMPGKIPRNPPPRELC